MSRAVRTGRPIICLLAAMLLAACGDDGGESSSPRPTGGDRPVDLAQGETSAPRDTKVDSGVDADPSQFRTTCPDVDEIGRAMRLALEVEHTSEDPDEGLDCAYRTDPADPYGTSVRLYVITASQAEAMFDNLVEQGIIDPDESNLTSDADEGMEWAEANIASGCGPDGTTCDWGGEYDRAVRVDRDTWYTVYGSEAFQGPDGPYRFAIIDAFAMVDGTQCHVMYVITKPGTELDIDDHAKGPIAMAQDSCGIG